MLLGQGRSGPLAPPCPKHGGPQNEAWQKKREDRSRSLSSKAQACGEGSLGFTRAYGSRSTYSKVSSTCRDPPVKGFWQAFIGYFRSAWKRSNKYQAKNANKWLDAKNPAEKIKCPSNTQAR